MNSSALQSNDTNELNRDENLALIEIGTLSVIFVLIVFGNSCVLLALAVRRLKMTRMYYYLLHLCISDLITGFFTVLPQLAWDITYRFNGGNFLCKLIKFLQILGPYLSSYVLVMTAIDRYQAICFPLSNCGWTPRRSKLMILIAWIISICCSLPQVLIFSYQRVSDASDVYDCWGTFPQPWGERIYVTWYAVSVFFIPLIILVFTHIYICHEIWVNVSMKRQMAKRENECNASSRKRKCLTIAFNRVYRNRRKRNADRQVDTVNDANSYPSVVVHSSHDGKTEHTIVTCEDSMNDSPRVNTVHRLSKAKIKTVKITVVVILCYITCSSPFICVQLWAYWWPDAQKSAFWTSKSSQTFYSYFSFI